MAYWARMSCRLALVTSIWSSGYLRGEVLLETSLPGLTNGGNGLHADKFLGARFTLDERTLVTGIGGHVKGSSAGDRTLFFAVVPTHGPGFFPSDTNLTEAVFSTVVTAPFNDVGPYPYQVPDTVVPVSLVLEAGTYGLVIGSGLFGATGNGWMPVRGSSIPLPWYFILYRNAGDFFQDLEQAQPQRFLVFGEPAGPVDAPKLRFAAAAGGIP